ncbi:TonB family C-terminal domain-containing protein [Saccharicrinis carchari]|uniref:TonB family C-terminal domain-containing protein n=1 Tax=Saccharicrinis carchari TaxID=1168039 RepID=A0A521DRB6_SACCC|nr:TonB family protein [Saccharicrinis carchari]SMO74263.1 TonB family C-terminal domain-containing protein [Saccharicrinis carchari]
MKTLLFTIIFAILSLSAYTQSEEIQAEKIYETVNQVPVFTKNRGHVQKYLSKNLQYPVDALAKAVEGKVLVSFVVSSSGNIKDIRLEEGLTPSTNEEALRVVGTMEKWKPAKLDGRNVATQVTIPVHFYLSEENKQLSQQLKPFYINNNPPLFIVDKKKVLGLTTLAYYNIKSIRVIKGEKAMDLYGKDAKNGVLVIETKRGTPRNYQRY